MRVMAGLLLKIGVITFGFCFIGIYCANPLQLNPEGLEFVKQVNESFYINCFHQNATDIWWFRNGVQPISDASSRVHVESGSSFNFTGAALVFTSIQSGDKGNYTCKAKVNNKTESISFVLSTYKPIAFRDTLPVQDVWEYESGVIRCDAEGEPEPTIRWLVNGKPIDKNSRYIPIGDGLLIQNVTLEDGKQDFICRAAAINIKTSNIKLKNIKLNVLHSPKLKGESSTILYGYVGGKMNITCEVDSNPPANFTWHRNFTRFFGEANATIFYEQNKSILMISSINDSVFGEYRCRATNEKGSAESIFILKKIRKPDAPKKAKVHSTTHNSLQLEIHSPSSREQDITGYKVQIMERKEKDKGKHWEVAREVILPKGKPFIISDLKPNTEYVVRVTSQNEAGSGDFTNEFKTKTLSSTSSCSTFKLSQALLFLLILIRAFKLA